MSIRTNDHPTILRSGFHTLYWDDSSVRPADFYERVNPILRVYHDVHDGIDTVRELLWTTQLLRVEYDSPRIGGGIDPDIACLGMGHSLDGEREVEGSFAHYLLGPGDDSNNYLEHYCSSVREIQDAIVHAEEVARKWLAVFGEEDE